MINSRVPEDTLVPIKPGDLVVYKRGDVVTLDFTGSQIPYPHRPEHGRQAIVLRPIGTNTYGSESRIVYEVLVGLQRIGINEYWFE